MLRLRTFGGLLLEDEGGPLTGTATQRRKLALLALLAAAGERGMSRDRVVTYFWPESDTTRARNSLAQLLYALRQALPADPVAAGSTELRLNPEVISSDVGEFDAAIASGNHQCAVTLYAGPFLDGFHLDGAPEFERWVDGERSVRAQQVATALEALADEASERGDHTDAAGWWRRLAALDPLNGRVALGLMAALDAAGDRAGALQHARLHEVLLREELDTAPDAAVLALAEQLRTAPAPERPGPNTVQPVAGVLTQDQSSPETEGSQHGRPLGAPAVPRRRRRITVLSGALVALIVVAVVAGWAVWKRSRPPSPTLPATIAVAVLPFEVRGSPEYTYLGEGMVDLLSANLDGAGELRAVDPRALLSFAARVSEGTADPERGRAIAERFNARRFVLGTIVEAGGQLRISATLYDRSYGPSVIAQASVAGEAAQLFELVDDLTAELLADSYGGPRERITRTAATTTHSIPALKAYLVGEGHLRAARYGPAVEAFQRAVADDSTFALAYYRLSLAAEWADRLALEIDASDRAERHSARLAEHDRLLVQALHARRRGAADQAERLYRTVLARYPDDVEAWYQLGEVLFHHNAYRGRSLVESRGAWERVLALEPDHRDALVHLARVAAREGKRAQLDSLLTRALALSPPPEQLELRAFRAFALGTDRDQERVIEELRTAGHAVLWQSAWRIAVYTHD
ncbi:MAG: tetratricopeptide repeat protein, partial [Gemmatimonadota bacterium]|nr:tetratricopeptide repeat protein [Gemmatimonadota bacterium]